MDIEAVLPQMVVAYRRGLLVPFIGSGMSAPTCAGWPAFLLALAREAAQPVPAQLREAIAAETVASTALYRLADDCVRRLKARGRAAFTAACRAALYAPGEASVPPQAHALARTHWPLVLSTNYDDLLLRAARDRHEEARRAGGRAAGLPPLFELVGQSVQDCHAVLRALDVVTDPVLWALQGYLGDQALTRTALSEAQALRLQREVVIGHQQYQAVINAQPHLRRAIAEVFRRRSLLFLGSGVQEDYLVNLFGEIIHHHGPSAHTHVAVFTERKRATVDEKFFRLRLGIEPVFVPSFAAIPALLDKLAANVAPPREPDARSFVSGCAPYELAYRVHGAGMRPEDGIVLRLRNEAEAVPQASNACVAVSVGRSPDRTLAFGSMTVNLLRAAGIASPRWMDFTAVDDGAFVHQHGANPAIFAIAARDTQDAKQPDRRDLQIIPAALGAFLSHIEKTYASATIGMLAAGERRPWPSLFPFIMMLSAIRTFAAGPRQALREISIAIVDPAVWIPLLAGKLPVEQFLASGTATVCVFVGDPADDLEFYAIMTAADDTVRDLAKRCDLGDGDWHVTVYPLPAGDDRSVADFGALAVVPGTTVMFAPGSAGMPANFGYAGR
jgi:SIR2-like domain